jgi:hypothetical protein
MRVLNCIARYINGPLAALILYWFHSNLVKSTRLNFCFEERKKWSELSELC